MKKIHYKFILLILWSLISSAEKSELIDKLEPQYDKLTLNANIEGSTMSVQAKYQINTIKETTNTLDFLLNPAIKIKKIDSKNLISYDLGPKDGRPLPFWKLHFSKSIAINQPVEINFEYAIDLSKSNHLDSDWIELNVDKLWFPKYNDFDTKFNYELKVNGLPESFTATFGTQAIVKNKKNVIKVTNKNVPVLEILFLAGRNMRWKTFKDSDIKIFVSNDTSEDILDSIHNKVKYAINFYNGSFGSSNKIRSYSVVLRNASKVEIPYQVSRVDLMITSVDFNTFENYAHEIAHFWWHEADFIKEPWLNESFANYSTYLALEEYNKTTYDKLFKQVSNQVKSAIPVSKASLFEADSYLSYYYKGSVLLKRLEFLIGKNKMIELLKTRIEKRINTTEQLVNTLEKLTNTQVKSEFMNWLEE